MLHALGTRQCHIQAHQPLGAHGHRCMQCGRGRRRGMGALRVQHFCAKMLFVLHLLFCPEKRPSSLQTACCHLFVWIQQGTERPPSSHSCTLTEYATEVSQQTSAFFRPNFWVNTPDILPFHLQSGNPAIFAIRAALAATLSPSWGLYAGYELYEHRRFKEGG